MPKSKLKQTDLPAYLKRISPRDYGPINDWFFSSWDRIVKAHRAGLPVERRHVEAMLRRHEPVPPEAQDFLVDEYVKLKPKKKRGGQRVPSHVKKFGSIKKAVAKVAAIERLKSQTGTLAKAYEAYAEMHGPMEPASVEREYREAINLKREYDAIVEQGWRQLEAGSGLSRDDIVTALLDRTDE